MRGLRGAGVGREFTYLLQALPIPVMAALVTGRRIEGAQMVVAEPILACDDGPIVQLGEADAPEMLALAQLTSPGHSVSTPGLWMPK